MIAEAHGKRVRLVKGIGWALKLMSYVTPVVNKAFGSLRYEMGMSGELKSYNKYSLEESTQRTEQADE